MKPDRVTIRTYQVGFGDCFLLSFHYPEENRHVLIDFGSTGLPDDVPRSRMKDIAEDIRQIVDGERLAVVATHRHKDHISGFSTNAKGNGTGDVIRKLKPRLVTQPWTEDPDLATDATAPRASLTGTRRAAAARIQTLARMQQVASQVWAEVKRNRSLRGPLRTQLGFLGENNIANPSAVKNLMSMGPTEYVYFGKRTRLARHLPGVEIDVHGPPTVQQYGEVKRQRQRDEDEFWHLMAAAGESVRTTKGNKAEPLFPRHVTPRQSYRFPVNARWLIQRAKGLRTDQMLRIVRALDKALNNTSVILLFRAGGKSLLFPGDAQIENWEYALSKPHVIAKLKAVDLYKVGHHGSLNATPRTLWASFQMLSENEGHPKRLISLMSTMPGKHGHEDANTEVPREKLTRQLRKLSDHFTTEALKPNELCHTTVVDL
jgi:hypothetical protein